MSTDSKARFVAKVHARLRYVHHMTWAQADDLIHAMHDTCLTAIADEWSVAETTKHMLEGSNN